MYLVKDRSIVWGKCLFHSGLSRLFLIVFLYPEGLGSNRNFGWHLCFAFGVESVRLVLSGMSGRLFSALNYVLHIIEVAKSHRRFKLVHFGIGS